MNKTLLTTTALIGIFYAGTNANAETDGPAKSAQPEATARSTEQAEESLSDIVVTAQRRSETAQRAAAAITAISGDNLKALGIRDSRDLQKILPSVEIKPEGPVSQTFIRGVGNNIDTPYSNPGVAYNLNGVVLPRYATASAFFDLERVEVLPGPQGTLYGGTAAGGVINLVARIPTNDFNGEATLEGGNYAFVHGFLGQNLALGETLSARVALDYERHDGYQSRGLSSDDRKSGRLSLLWNPNSTTKLLLWGQGYSDTGKPSAAGLYTRDSATRNFLLTFPANPLIDPSDAWYVPRVGLAGNPIDVSAARKHYKNYAFGARLDVELGGLTLSYIPGLVLIRNDSLFYAGTLPFIAQDRENQLTQELKLANDPTSRFSWIAGLYYYHDKIRFNQIVAGAPNLLIPRQIDESYAAYAQATFKVTDALRLIAGGRVSSDSKDAVGTSLGIPFAAHNKNQRVDFKVSVEHDLAPDVLLYGAIQSGYLPGGYTPAPKTATFNNNVDPETLLSYTAGIKSRLLDGLLTLNSEAYYYAYRDYQVVALDLSTGQPSIYSAQRARVYGNQINATLRPTSTTTLNGGIGIMSAKFTKFILPNGQSFSGNRLTNAANFTASVDATQRIDLANGGDVTANVHNYFNSGYFGQYDNTPEVHQKSFNKTDISLTYNARDKRWFARAWVLNVANTAVRGGDASLFPGLAARFIDPPRTYGISIGTKW
jgi:iron complex outermembrane receptor protein